MYATRQGGIMKKYEESLKTCIFLARTEFFTVVADLSDEYQSNLCKKIENIIEKNKLESPANGGLFGGRYGVKWHHQLFAKAAVAAGFSRMNPIFRIPGFYTHKNANPRKAYQKWCNAFAGAFDNKDYETIISASIENDDNFYQYGCEAWNDINEQKNWSVSREIEHLLAR